MLAGPLAALQRLGVLTRGGEPIRAAARLSSYAHSSKIQARLFRRGPITPISPTATVCSAITDKMAETNGVAAATLEEVEALRKQVDDLKVNQNECKLTPPNCVFSCISKKLRAI